MPYLDHPIYPFFVERKVDAIELLFTLNRIPLYDVFRVLKVDENFYVSYCW